MGLSGMTVQRNWPELFHRRGFGFGPQVSQNLLLLGIQVDAENDTHLAGLQVNAIPPCFTPAPYSAKDLAIVIFRIFCMNFDHP